MNLRYIATIDIGGSSFCGSLYTDELELVAASDRYPTKSYASKEVFLEKILSIISDLKHANSIDSLSGISVSSPGPLDVENGIILDTPNIKAIQNLHLQKEIENMFNCITSVQNDANLFAYGESYIHRVKDMVAVTLGTGLGFSIIHNDNIFLGSNKMACEYGLSPIDSNEKTWEDILTIRWFNQISAEKLGKMMDPEDVYNLARESNKDALSIWSMFGKNLGMCLAHAINFIDPAIIVIGGGISQAHKYFHKPMEAMLSASSPSFVYNKIDIIYSKDTKQSSQLGAARYIRGKLG